VVTAPALVGRRLALWLLSVLAAGFPPIDSAPALPVMPDVERVSSSPTRAPASARPNVLIIVTDDQRSDMLEVLPRTRGWFEDGGTRFTEAFATTPLCCPSRATIFTGRYAHNHGVLNNAMAGRLDQSTTIQRYLHDAGYRTAIAGKFLNEWSLDRDPPHFDRWAIFNENTSYANVPFNVDGRVRAGTGYSTHFVARQSTEFLRWFERRDRRPWLLFVAPLAPHKPFTPSPRYRNASVPPPQLNPAVHEQDLSDKPPFLRDRELGRRGARRVRRAQLRTLKSVDDLVGRLTTLLRRLGETDRTLAFFLSDNGFVAGEHGMVDKRLPYSESARIPLMMRWKDHMPSGVEDARLVSTADLAPTVLAAAGIQRRFHPPLDGRSLTTSAREELFLEYFFDPVRPVPRWASIRSTSYQYVEYYGGSGGVLFREYYDLTTDPWQLANLLHDGSPGNDPPPDQLDVLRTMTAQGRRCRGTGGRNPCP
jgi:arylsulfatase A-like enzyme